MSIRTLACAAALLLALPLATQAQSFKTRNYSATVRGKTVIMDGWSCWHDNCKFANCRINDVEKPRLGQVSVRIRSGRIPANGGHCAGRPTKVLDIYYTPKPGAKGRDSYSAHVVADNGGRYILNFKLRVR